MIEDTASLPGYTIFHHEENDQAPDLSKQAVMHPLGMFESSLLTCSNACIPETAAANYKCDIVS